MPHLSPMHWLFAIMSTTLLMLTMTSIFWWTQAPSFATSNLKQKKLLSKWNWL